MRTTYRGLLIAVTILLIGVVGRTSAQTAGYQLLTAPLRDYQFQVPADWSTVSLPDGVSIGARSSAGPYAFVLEQPQPQGGALSDATLLAVTAQVATTGFRGWNNVTITTPAAPSQVPGATFAAASAASFQSDDGTPMHQRAVSAALNGTGYTLFLMEPANYDQAYPSMGSTVINSFQLLAPSSSTAAAAINASVILSGSASAPAGSGPIFQAQGSADQRTESFTVPSSWSALYTYDCSEFANSQGGDFSVYIRMPDGSYSGTNSPIQSHPQGDTGSGTQNYHTSGTFSFDVVSDCTWSLSVTAP